MCSNEECERPVHGRGLCQAHYRQAVRRERGLKKPGSKRDPSKPYSKYRDRSQCPDGHPYEDGSFKLTSHGHRICLICQEKAKKTHCPQGHSYEEYGYQRADGAVQCRECVRLRMRERRPATGVGPGGVNRAKTHCPQGHEYTEENTALTKDGKRRMCRTCSRSKSNLQNVKRYGIDPETIAEMLIKQDNRCPICNRRFLVEVGKWHIDHDHACCPNGYSCGKCVRQLLCSTCNQGLGHFQDNVEWLGSAIDYLTNYQKIKAS